METVLAPQVIAEKLWSVIGDQKCVAWIGSGLSDSVYPRLDQLLPDLCLACGIDQPDSAANFADVAQACKDRNPDAYYATLGDIYGTPKTVTRQAYQLLTAVNFIAYVTTNFDPLLARSGRICSNTYVYKYPDLSPRHIAEHRPIYYIHGLVERPDDPERENLILARSDFNEAYDLRVRGFLQEILMEYPVVFLGCSLGEECIADVFRQVGYVQRIFERMRRGRVLPSRFALLQAPGILPSDDGYNNVSRRAALEAVRFRELGIEALTYPYDMSHAPLDDVLTYLVDLQRRPSDALHSAEEPRS